jgi:hypothetical protein
MKHIFAGFNLIGAIALLGMRGGSAGTNLLSPNKELLTSVVFHSFPELYLKGRDRFEIN